MAAIGHSLSSSPVVNSVDVVVASAAVAVVGAEAHLLRAARVPRYGAAACSGEIVATRVAYLGCSGEASE